MDVTVGEATCKKETIVSVTSRETTVAVVPCSTERNWRVVHHTVEGGTLVVEGAHASLMDEEVHDEIAVGEAHVRTEHCDSVVEVARMRVVSWKSVAWTAHPWKIAVKKEVEEPHSRWECHCLCAVVAVEQHSVSKEVEVLGLVLHCPPMMVEV